MVFILFDQRADYVSAKKLSEAVVDHVVVGIWVWEDHRLVDNAIDFGLLGRKQ